MLLLATLSAQARPARPWVRALPTDQAPTIDGRLDEPCWKAAPALTNFTQVLPREGAPPTERTEVRLLYTPSTLYIGIRCFDSQPDRIIAKQMRHDDPLISDDRVTVVFDTFDRQRDGYFFAINPAGARTEGLIEDFDKANRLWDTVWRARAHVDAQGWAAEMAIPFKSLSFDPRHATWGFNVERVIRRKQETVRWAGVSRAKSVTTLSDFGEIRGLHGM